MQAKSVLVMLAAYNGAEYIVEQIDSILSQEGVRSFVFVRDDGSTDNTIELLESAYGDNERVRVVEGNENLGCAQSFMNMVWSADSTFDYYAFSDQDDYWKQGRLARAVQMMEQSSESFDVSILYCCNREEVNEKREFLYYNVPLDNIERCKSLEYLLFVRNIAPGNTMVFSRAFLEHLKCAEFVRFPSGFYHDYWVHVVAAALEDTTVIYDLTYCGVERRITGSNLAGFDRNKGRGIRALARQFSNYEPGSLQSIANAVLEKYDGQIDSGALKVLGSFADAKKITRRVELLGRSKTIKYDSRKGRLFGIYKIVSGKI